MMVNGTYDVDSVGEDVEVIRADGAHRLCLMPNYEPDAPYNDGSVPLFEIGRNQFEFLQIRQVTLVTSYDASYVDFADQVTRWGVGSPRVDDYLKQAYGATAVDWWNEGAYWYVALDTTAWREALGVTAEQIAEEYATTGTLMPEWKAWKTGDVWAYVIQEQVRWIRVDENDEPVFEADGPLRMHTWEAVDSLFGLYGRAYAEEEAREAYKALTGFPPDPQVPPEGGDPQPEVEGPA